MLVVLGACAPRRAPDPAPLLPMPAASANVETREVQLAGDLITVRLHIPPGGDPKKATVISTMTGHAAFLARGWLVATFRVNWEYLDPPLPPEAQAGEATVGKWVLASRSADVLGERYLRTIVVTANVVVPRIVDYLRTVPEVDLGRLAIVGASTNGFVTLQALTREPRITTAVALAACGDYRKFLQYSSMGMEGAPLDLAPGYARWIARQEPVRRPRRWLHAAVAMVNRDGDPIIPIECADATADAVAPVYERAGRADRFRYRVVHGTEHGLSSVESDEMMAWLDRWLAPRTARSGRRAEAGPR
jgi:pimeloyl-ACP methyl ester carboxylesterase